MTKPVIILDIDDVVLDWSWSFGKYYSVDLQKQLPLTQILNCQQDQVDKKVFEFNTSELFSTLPFIEHCQECINTFKDKFTFIAITSCGDHALTCKLRKRNLKSLPLEKIIFLPYHLKKQKKLVEFTSAVLYIDDDIENVMSGSDLGIPSYLFSRPHNAADNTLHRVCNWRDIESLMRSI